MTNFCNSSSTNTSILSHVSVPPISPLHMTKLVARGFRHWQFSWTTWFWKGFEDACPKREHSASRLKRDCDAGSLLSVRIRPCVLGAPIAPAGLWRFAGEYASWPWIGSEAVAVSGLPFVMEPQRHLFTAMDAGMAPGHSAVILVWEERGKGSVPWQEGGRNFRGLESWVDWTTGGPVDLSCHYVYLAPLLHGYHFHLQLLHGSLASCLTTNFCTWEMAQGIDA